MTLLRENREPGTWQRASLLDLACAATILLANPLLYLFERSPRYFPPDSVAYVVLSRDMAADLRLYLESWGHVDAGVILPPLFPALIAVGKPFVDNLFSHAEHVSTLSLLFAGIPMFALLRRTVSRIVATCAVVAVQINASYGLMGLSPLTESLFLAIVACTLLALQSCIDRPRWWAGLGTGALCGLVFLTRQIGLVLLPFSLLWILLSRTFRRELFAWESFAHLGLIISGFLAVSLPYAGALYHQSGEYPLRQRFRLGVYEVSTSDESVLAELGQIESRSTDSYAQVYAKRRELRRLLPDASEMYSHVLRPGEPDQGQETVLVVVWRKLMQPTLLIGNFSKNMAYLTEALGWLWMVLFIGAALSPLLLRDSTRGFCSRYLLAGFTLFSLASISVVSGNVERYVVVLFPFALLHAAGELYIVAHRLLPSGIRSGAAAASAACGAILLATATMPNFGPLLDLRSKPQSDMQICEGFVADSPIFALHPYGSYSVGGRYRALPNDSLDRVVAYARKTNVQWLVVSRIPGVSRELLLYRHAGWYAEPLLHRRYPDLLELQCVVAGGREELYRIRPADPS